MTELELAFVGEVLTALGEDRRRAGRILRAEGFSDVEIALGRMYAAAHHRPPTDGSPS